VSQAKTTLFAWRSYHLKQFDFETLPPALYGETSFAYACGAEKSIDFQGGAR
jgi:hypothetical protein